MFKIGCQTIVFSPLNIKDNIESIYKTISSIGYDGVETGIVHFDTNKVEFYKQLLAKTGLTLPAVHMGGNFLDKDSVKAQQDTTVKGSAKSAEENYAYLHSLVN